MLQLLLSSCLYISVATVFVCTIYHFRKNLKVRSYHKNSLERLNLIFLGKSLFLQNVFLKTLSTIVCVNQRNNGNSLVTDICIALILVFVFLVLALAVLRLHGVDDQTGGEESNRENEVDYS